MRGLIDLTMASGSPTFPPQSNRVRLVVASTVLLTFISYWRAAAVVLNDLGSSAFYAGGIAEQAVGKTAPWFILGVMLFSFAVRAVYVESCSMFTRGGVYRVVKEALGGTFAKLSVSALMFDYILTGPISGVSAGQYISGLINQLFLSADLRGWVPRAMHLYFHGTPQINENHAAAVFAVLVTLYYWWQNTKGIEESSDKALRVMQITTVMVVILLGWSAYTLFRVGVHLPPWPRPSNFNFSSEALGFLNGTSFSSAKALGLFGIMIAFGHSVLAMSGEESLAQVNRELASPKLKNLKRAAVIIALYSTIFTGFASLLAVMLIPDSVRVPVYKDNLIAGLAMYMSGPLFMRLAFRVFVVVVGFLILSGAINTSIIGSNGVLNRVSEDGVLTDWFRRPHRKYGTSYRIVNLVTGLQLLTIVLSRGDVYALGEAYAFGVIWSFTFNSLAMLVLRFKYHGERGWKVPPNFRIAGIEIPVGLGSVFIALLSVAVTNLFTKSVATKAGIVFSIVFFAIFTVSEQINKRKFAHVEQQMKEHFQLVQQETVEREAIEVRPGNVLVTVRDYNTLKHLNWALENTDTHEQDVVVMEARLSGYDSAEYHLAMEQIFSDYEQTLFTKTVSIAESYGKTISLLVVPARDVFSATVQTANSLESAAVVAGLSSKMTGKEQAFHLGQAWEAMPEPKRQFVCHVVHPDGTAETYRIGPHTPTMKSEDVQLVHKLWLEMKQHPGTEEIHHSDIITLALTRLARDYSLEKDSVLKGLNKGYLKIFLGYASGVGKSFRMLDEARRRHERGQDVVVGAIQPQLPAEAEAILRKLEVIPLKQVDDGTAIDVEAIIRRRPEACFIDGLAYDNPPGSRNATRWQDAKELVQAGVKVIASINIQYVTELREPVEAITGKKVTQTVPVSFLKSADEIEIVDAPLVEPLVRTPGEQMSIEKRQQQLSRLREMALVLAADVVESQLSHYVESHGIQQQYGTQERILVCITPRADAQEMIETAQVVAQRFHGELTVAYVNQPEISPVDRAVLDQKLALARTAGADVQILQGSEPLETILEFARTHRITQLFIGHSHNSRFWSGIRGSNVDKLVQKSRGMDVRIFPNKK
ncbi:MAG TPA: amino acid permease [Candidatus Angelobacter sp.]|nr:amino acid permease [Candidatus Angelobacter sp.]